jgi:hypothetical protein
MQTCPILMITTNKRKYFTEATNLPKLLEFAQTFNAELSLIESTEIQLLKYEELAVALCDDSYRTPKESRKAKLLRQIYPINTSHNRSSMLSNAQVIRAFILNKLQQGEVLKVKDVKSKFGNLKLSDSCISNHITAVRQEMKKSGYNVVRIAPGSYQLDLDT